MVESGNGQLIFGQATLDLSPFTPTQKRMLRLLGDGQPHTRVEVHSCLDDDLAGPTAIQYHLSTMRKILLAQGFDVVTYTRREGILIRLFCLLLPSG